MAAADLHAELASMRQELARAEPPAAGEDKGRAAVPPGVSLGSELGPPQLAPEIESFLHDLQTKWSESSADAEALVKSHPIAALAGAFLVGLAVGRLLGRHS